MIMMKSLFLLLLAIHSASSFTTLSLRNDQVRSRTVQKAVMIDLSSILNITSMRNVLCDEVMFERGIREIQQASGLPEPETNGFEVSPEVLEDLQGKSIQELKLVCSKRSIRYKGLEEHEEFVEAIVNNIKELNDFSVSGLLVPGVFNEISGDTLEQEMKSNSKLPILLDVYATYCGPCKLVESEFEVVARRLGKNCRVAKLDSQKYHDVANSLKVQGLPATILIHKGRIVSRREGLVSRDQLMDFVDTFVPKQSW